MPVFKTTFSDLQPFTSTCCGRSCKKEKRKTLYAFDGPVSLPDTTEVCLCSVY